MPSEKVLVITYYWPPSGGAGVQRALKFVRYFPDFGIEPIVLTVDPEKASYPVTDPTLSKDIPPGVRVVKTSSFEPLNLLSAMMGKKHVPYGGFANANKESKTQRMLRWIRGNFFIPDARVGWVKYACREAVKIIREENIRYVMISTPPHSTQLVGLKLKEKFPSLKWVADMRDPWTDIYYYKDLLHTAPAARKDAAYEKKVLEVADAVLVVSDAIKKSFVAKSSGVNSEKVHVVPNGYDEEDFLGEIHPEKGIYTIAYVGTMAENYKPGVFFESLAGISKRFPDVKLRFRFVGNTPWTIKKLTEKYGIDTYCEWIGHVTHEDAVRHMQEADMLLLIIPDAKGAEGILTGKLFEYIGAGRPILGIGPGQGDAAAILRECDAGEMFERTEQEAIQQWIYTHAISETRPPAGGSGQNYTRKKLTERVSKIILQ